MTLEQRVSRTEDRQDTMEELIRLVVQDIEGTAKSLKKCAVKTVRQGVWRIWIAIARKQELFDDDEFQDVFGDENR